MKKYILLALSIYLVTAAFAQQGFHLGASGTFNSTWILNQNNYGTLAPFSQPVVRQSEMAYKKTWGGNAGLVLGYNFTNNWGLKLEVQYNVTGQNYEDNFSGPAIIPQGTFGPTSSDYVNVIRTIKLQYIQIPLMVRYITSKGKIAKFYAAFGPLFGARTYAYEQVKIAGYEYVNPKFDYAAKDKFSGFDAGLALQFGTYIFFTRHLYMDIGFSTYGGLADINSNLLKTKTSDWYSKNDVGYQKSHNFRAGLTLGINYIFGKGLSEDPLKKKKKTDDKTPDFKKQ